MLIVDLIFILLVLFASFSIRLGIWYVPDLDVAFLILAAPIVAIPIFISFGLYQAVIRYVGFKALWAIVQAVTVYAFAWGILAFMSNIDGIPRSVILINWTLLLLVVGSIRVSARWFFSRRRHLQKKIRFGLNVKNTLVYGAGDAGIQLVNALKHASEHIPVGFIDDSKELQGNYIEGLRVYSPDNIGNVISTLKIVEVLIAMPSIARSKRIEIVNELEQCPVTVRMLPGVAALAEGKVSINDLRKVSIKDLLGRDTVNPNKSLLSKNITDKVVLVTGAGGSIGSELCRQIVNLKPKSLILYEVSEYALYSIEKELVEVNKLKIDIFSVLGNVTNKSSLERVFKEFNISTVYHTAAYKHVPLVEKNNIEGVSNNIFGTLNCAKVAINNNVETFVLISTDKAVRPTNTMGATKRCAELILQALSNKASDTKFTMVRFGNVLDSSGSVIPLFKSQIEKGGPVTVTDENIIRYFMMIPEAVELVIQAGAMGTGGDVFVLDMGQPVKIKELAEKMIRLSGLEVKDKLNPHGDIEIKYVGLRPGEKLYEELLIGNRVNKTENPLIMRAKEEMIDWDILEPKLKEINKAVKNHNLKKLRSLLIEILPEFKPENKF